MPGERGGEARGGASTVQGVTQQSLDLSLQQSSFFQHVWGVSDKLLPKLYSALAFLNGAFLHLAPVVAAEC